MKAGFAWLLVGGGVVLMVGLFTGRIQFPLGGGTFSAMPTMGGVSSSPTGKPAASTNPVVGRFSGTSVNDPSIKPVGNCPNCTTWVATSPGNATGFCMKIC